MLRRATALLTRPACSSLRAARAFSTEVAEAPANTAFNEAWKKVVPHIEPPKTPLSFMNPRPAVPSSIPTKLTVNFVLPYASELSAKESREFKYNRQAFDQKAQSMTEKYAQDAASESSVCDGQCQSLVSLTALEVDTTGLESKHQANESVPEDKTSSHGLKPDANQSVTSHKKLIGINRKLSLESSVLSCERGAHKEGREVPKDKMEVKGTEKMLKDNDSKCNLSQEKLCGSRRKLSLGSLSQSQEVN